MENKNGSMVFLGVIGVATLVVAIIGATFAFFSASASSENGAVTAGAANISLGFTDQSYRNLKTHLVPASENVATYAAVSQSGTGATANQQCVDDNTNEVCSVYEYTVTNDSPSTITITTTLEAVTNTFTTTNLKYKVYAGSTDASANLTGLRAGVTKLAYSGTTAPTPIIAATTVPATGANNKHTLELGGTGVTEVTLNPNESRTYTIIIWIQNLDSAQDADQGKAFAATLSIDSGSGEGVYGVISGVSD
jgi:predicted ribosomally synthesized peptide with SipW-like signal peptide